MIDSLDNNKTCEGLTSLHELDLTELSKVIGPDACAEIKTLLNTITQIQLTPIRKLHLQHRVYLTMHHRYLFLDENGINVIGEIYKIIAACIAKIFYSKTDPGFKLACYGSTVIGYSTIPISKELISPHQSSTAYLNIVTQSDIDFFLLFGEPRAFVTWDEWKPKSDMLLEIMQKVSDSMPQEIRFKLPESIQPAYLPDFDSMRIESIRY